MKKFIILFLLAAVNSLSAQQNPQDSTRYLDETVISASRTTQSKSAVAQNATVLKKQDIESANAASTADLLSGTGQVFVQKSQLGGGSPVLRGFEASRVLLVVDGIRMNNAIYRAGHLQNVITMDNAALERAEILFGPASTVYGSDALGGAICFFTKDPEMAAESGSFLAKTGAFFRYGSASKEKTGHVDISLGGHKLAALTSFTFSDFDDLRMGKKEGSAPFFGKRDYYVERINGVDSLIKNEDPYVQKFTGYKQYDLLEKIVFKPGEHTKHTVNVQFSTSSNIPRYDRLTDPSNSTGLASAEWYYGPQKRLLAAYSLNQEWSGAIDGFNLTASWQDVEESRHNRNFGATRRTDRVEQVKVYGLLAELYKNWKNQSLRFGLDGQYNTVKSTAQRVNVNTGEVTTQSTRYPDGDNNMMHAALFAMHSWQPANISGLHFSEGLRAGFSSLKSTFVSREFYPFPFSKIEQQSPTFSGSAGAVWNANRHWRFALNLSSGFRVPNIDDLTKIFDSQPGKVVVPNPDLKPEKTLNGDVNIGLRLGSRLLWENTFWATSFRDAIVTDLFQFNGEDSIEYNQTPSQVLAPQNKRKATLWGISSSLQADVLPSLAAYGTVSYTRGRIDDEAETPLDHIPPLFGKAGLRWHAGKASAEAFCLFNGKKNLEDYNLEGEDNLQYAPADGMPSWYTLNLKGQYGITKNIGVSAGIDNLLDVQYRTFASGINGPGRNFWLTLRLNW